MVFSILEPFLVFAIAVPGKMLLLLMQAVCYNVADYDMPMNDSSLILLGKSKFLS